MVVESYTYSINGFDDIVFITPPKFIWKETNFIGKHILNKDHIDNNKFQNIKDRIEKYRLSISYLLFLSLSSYVKNDKLPSWITKFDIDNLHSCSDYLAFIHQDDNCIRYSFRIMECLHRINCFLDKISDSLE